MKYIYTRDMCGACVDLKAQLDEDNIKYVERSAERLSAVFTPKDDIDFRAFVQLQMQNQTLPVTVDVPE